MSEGKFVPDGYEFALCLTHDVDRPYKTYQALYYAITERDPSHLRALAPGGNSYWQFEEIMELEERLGVRSAFYFLQEQHILDRPRRCLLELDHWVEHAGRYDVTNPAITDVMAELSEGGWEVGLHGSYISFDDRDRLATEKATVEHALGEPVRGGRQHHLRLRVPDTWRHYAAIGLEYDASFGSGRPSVDDGDPFFPFGDDFLVFPLSLMEVRLPSDPRLARESCEAVLDRAAERSGVATVLWHPRYFSERDFPGYRDLYRHLVEYAQDRGAWVGPPADLYDRVVDDSTVAAAGAVPSRPRSDCDRRPQVCR